MNDIVQNRTLEIITLHTEIMGHLKQSLDKAICIGGLLAEQKANIAHGEFTGWIETNLPFSTRTARNYMRLYRQRDKLKTERISDLDAAYHFLVHDKRSTFKEEREKQAKEIEYRKNHPEECEKIGESWEETTEGGVKIKCTVAGQLMGFPIIGNKPIDPKFNELEAGSAPYELKSPMRDAINSINRSAKEVKNAHKKWGHWFYNAYDIDYSGIQYLFLDLMEAHEQLRRVMNNIEKNKPENIIQRFGARLPSGKHSLNPNDDFEY